MREWRYSFTILDLRTSWLWVISFTLLPLYPRKNLPRYSLDIRLGGLQISEIITIFKFSNKLLRFLNGWLWRKSATFWEVMSCILVKISRRFEATPIKLRSYYHQILQVCTLQKVFCFLILPQCVLHVRPSHPSRFSHPSRIRFNNLPFDTRHWQFC
jgi:hypothetical protein